MKKFISINTVVALLLGLVVGLGITVLRPQTSTLGGQSNFSGPVNSEEGFQVDGTTRIDTDGVFTGTVGSSSVLLGNVSTSLTSSISAELRVSRLRWGGGRLDLGEAATLAPTAAQICNNGVISFAPRAEFASVTLPTAANLIADCLGGEGDTKVLLWKNTGLSAVSSTTFASSSGIAMRLQMTSGTTIINKPDLAASSTALITLTNTGSSTIDTLIQSFRPCAGSCP